MIRAPFRSAPGFIPLGGISTLARVGSIRTRPEPCSRRMYVVSAHDGGRPLVPASQGVRINKCFKSRFSRRESDVLVESGRVNVNGFPAEPGARVSPGDVVTLDGETVEWERLTLSGAGGTGFTYLKFHKPLDVVTTTDAEIENNIVSCLRNAGYDGKDRIFFVGRLDEQTTGLILCTTDGSLVNAALGGSSTSVKEYVVTTDLRVTDEDMDTLRNGVVIKTVAQHARGRPALVVPTLPCRVERVVPDDEEDLQIRVFLNEGRNRQIRKMLVCAANLAETQTYC